MSSSNEVNSFFDSVVQVDRMLMTALKKNLKVARHLFASISEGPQKESLSKMLKKHPLVPKEKVTKKAQEAPTEAKKRQSRILRYLDDLPGDHFETVLELVKSFVRRQKNNGQESPKGRSANAGRKKRTGGADSADQGQTISGASSTSASDAM